MKGVFFDPHAGKWRAWMMRDCKRVYLGSFVTQLEAEQARITAYDPNTRFHAPCCTICHRFLSPTRSHTCPAPVVRRCPRCGGSVVLPGKHDCPAKRCERCRRILPKYQEHVCTPIVVSEATRQKLRDMNLRRWTAEAKKRRSEQAAVYWTAERRQRASELARWPPFCSEQTLRVCHFRHRMSMQEIADKYEVSIHAVQVAFKTYGIQPRSPGDYNKAGANNPKWRDHSLTYGQCHQRVIACFGRPKKCEACGLDDQTRRYEWANLTGHYEDVHDYRRLCKPCHVRYDKARRVARGGVPTSPGERYILTVIPDDELAI